jgi:LmbE family N-acetylglucosaminyl deacetylase
MAGAERLAPLHAARRVLCVQPHYDDNDLGIGGTVAALADAGAEIHYLTVTDDLVGVLDAGLSDEEATRRLRAEQHQAGAVLGVAGQHWLGLPDAGPYDYYALRNGIVRHIRALRPDVVFGVDPWLPFESHSDHLRSGRAVAEACLLHRHRRLRIDPEVDARWAAQGPHDITALALYFTCDANACFDVTATRERKAEAIGAYRTQLTDPEIAALRAGLAGIEQRWAADEPFSHGEALRVLSPGVLHVNLLPELV